MSSSVAAIGAPASMSPAARSSRRLVRAERRLSTAAAFFAFTSRRCRFPALSGMCPSLRESAAIATGLAAAIATGLAAAVQSVTAGWDRVQPARARWVVGGEHRRTARVLARASAHGAHRRALPALGWTQPHAALADLRHGTPSCIVGPASSGDPWGEGSAAVRMMERGAGRSDRTTGSDPVTSAYYRLGIWVFWPLSPPPPSARSSPRTMAPQRKGRRFA